jgi:hypothetical protein
MTPTNANKFKRIFNSTLGPGVTLEHAEPIELGGRTLAYIDYDESGGNASAVCFTPWQSGQRAYAKRAAAAAEGIVHRHLAKLGFDPGEPRDLTAEL